jgi:hypothetical protein
MNQTRLTMHQCTLAIYKRWSLVQYWPAEFQFYVYFVIQPAQFKNVLSDVMYHGPFIQLDQIFKCCVCNKHSRKFLYVVFITNTHANPYVLYL